MITWFWHRYMLRHKMIHYQEIAPTYHTPSGINVFEQTEFKIPVAHWKCSCGNGEIWEDRDLEYVLFPISILIGIGTMVLAGIAVEHWWRNR